VRYQLHAQHLAGNLACFIGVLCQLHASAFTAATRMNLRLNDDRLAGQLFSRLVRLVSRVHHDASGHRHAKLLQ
jgi:hypothetical protein